MRGGKAFIGLTVVLVILILLNLPLPLSLRIKARLRDNLAPLRSALASLGNRVGGATSFLGDAFRAGGEKQRTQRELVALRSEIWRLRALEEENRELRTLVDFRKSQKQRLVLCQVVSRGDASGWWETITLDRGEDSGIAANLAVVTADGLVGRVLTVTRQTCDVLLISDPNFKAACRIVGTDATGIVRGMGVRLPGKPGLEMLCPPEPYRLDYLSRDERVLDGAEVRTSGMGGVLPEGIPVGRIRRIAPDVSGLYQKADLEPAAKLRSLRHVFVVLFKPEG